MNGSDVVASLVEQYYRMSYVVFIYSVPSLIVQMDPIWGLHSLVVQIDPIWNILASLFRWTPFGVSLALLSRWTGFGVSMASSFALTPFYLCSEAACDLPTCFHSELPI
ncbi:hypothetical protein PoB_003336000 [Plakobranchus ocellatus]|uniref:Uncharacterized protein n=1 Tax=Plakobranchus ocellatus TaxID=259542 RepID=A0AAV4AJ62_9GAST|nr:hypothetical protein PoB_003336000 [Plakobranchus ocellatus]